MLNVYGHGKAQTNTLGVAEWHYTTRRQDDISCNCYNISHAITDKVYVKYFQDNQATIKQVCICNLTVVYCFCKFVYFYIRTKRLILTFAYNIRENGTLKFFPPSVPKDENLLKPSSIKYQRVTLYFIQKLWLRNGHHN